jgi:hypothetical protein
MNLINIAGDFDRLRPRGRAKPTCRTSKGHLGEWIVGNGM